MLELKSLKWLLEGHRRCYLTIYPHDIHFPKIQSMFVFVCVWFFCLLSSSMFNILLTLLFPLVWDSFYFITMILDHVTKPWGDGGAQI